MTKRKWWREEKIEGQDRKGNRKIKIKYEESKKRRHSENLRVHIKAE